MRKYILALFALMIGGQTTECANKRSIAVAMAEDGLRTCGGSPDEFSSKPGGKAPGIETDDATLGFMSLAESKFDVITFSLKLLENAIEEKNQSAFNLVFKALLEITPGHNGDAKIELLQQSLFGREGITKKMVPFFRNYFDTEAKAKQHAAVLKKAPQQLAASRNFAKAKEPAPLSDKEFDALIDEMYS